MDELLPHTGEPAAWLEAHWRQGMERGPPELPTAMLVESLHSSFNYRIIPLKFGPRELTIHQWNPACADFREPGAQLVPR